MRIVLEHAEAGYGIKKENRVLSDLSSEIVSGENVSVIGPNGSGKTTLLRVLSGILPYEGSVQIDGREISEMKRKELSSLIALMPQFSGVYFSYTVKETILFGRYVHSSSRLGIPSKKDLDVVERCLEWTGLSDLADRRTGELSGGQQQRVFIARTFAQETPFILLDEAANHLDLRYRAELDDALAQWSEGETRGIHNTVISVCHDLSEAVRLADQVIVMKGGAIAAQGAAGEVLTESLLARVFETDVAGRMREDLRFWEGIRP